LCDIAEVLRFIGLGIKGRGSGLGVGGQTLKASASLVSGSEVPLSFTE
jgi:hypothetical protein